jgi:hypothetical protein
MTEPINPYETFYNHLDVFYDGLLEGRHTLKDFIPFCVKPHYAKYQWCMFAYKALLEKLYPDSSWLKIEKAFPLPRLRKHPVKNLYDEIIHEVMYTIENSIPVKAYVVSGIRYSGGRSYTSDKIEAALIITDWYGRAVVYSGRARVLQYSPYRFVRDFFMNNEPKYWEIAKLVDEGRPTSDRESQLRLLQELWDELWGGPPEWARGAGVPLQPFSPSRAQTTPGAPNSF